MCAVRGVAVEAGGKRVSAYPSRWSTGPDRRGRRRGTPRDLRLSAMADTRHVPAADLAAVLRGIESVLVEEAR